MSRGDLRSKLDHKRVQRLASGSHHDSQQSSHSFNNRRGNNFDNRERKPRQFILVKLSYNEAENAPSIITRSAQVKNIKKLLRTIRIEHAMWLVVTFPKEAKRIQDLRQACFFTPFCQTEGDVNSRFSLNSSIFIS